MDSLGKMRWSDRALGREVGMRPRHHLAAVRIFC